MESNHHINDPEFAIRIMECIDRLRKTAGT